MPVLKNHLDCLPCFCCQRKEAEEPVVFNDIRAPADPVPSQPEGVTAASSPPVAQAPSQTEGVTAASSPPVAQVPFQADGATAASASSKFGFLWLCEEAESRRVPSAVLRTYLQTFQPPPHADAPPDSPLWAALLTRVVAFSQDEESAPSCPAELERFQHHAAVPQVPEGYAFQALVAPGGGIVIHETALRGVTIPMLEVIAEYVDRLCAAAEARGEAWVRPDGSRVPPGGSNLYEVVTHVVKPATGRFECSLVELMSTEPLPPDFFVSHFWGESLRVSIKCLRQLCEDKGRDVKTTVFWICAFALRQHDVEGELLGGVTTSPFVRALHVAEAAVSVVDAGGVYFNRAWCVLEQHFALVRPRLAFEHHMVTHRQDEDLAVCLLEGFGVEDKGLRDDDDNKEKQQREAKFPRELVDKAAAFNLGEAQASEKRDLIAIRSAVGSEVAALEATVRARAFTASRLGEELAGKAPTQLSAEGVGLRERMLEELYASRLRKVSIYLYDNNDLEEDVGAQLCTHLPWTVADLRVSEGAVPALATGLERRMLEGSLASLQRVELVHCRLDADGAMALGRILAATTCRVHTLNLRRNGVGDEGARGLGEGLKDNTSLTSLNLMWNGVGDEGRAALAGFGDRVKGLA